ncbi:LuxR C-terminal-related transcriptional regulator [Pseudomonas sp. NPDC090202]|uniref:LuxR C-terminal-related transcriptional regulator n=1 Tax=Pseudomonas sp. NPDC090202 TaxID=3364476 RepID=UPI0037FBF847
MQEPQKRKRPRRATARERVVLQLVMAGCSNKDIAERLGISYYTARDHVSALLRKHQVKSRVELVSLQIRPGH